MNYKVFSFCIFFIVLAKSSTTDWEGIIFHSGQYGAYEYVPAHDLVAGIIVSLF